VRVSGSPNPRPVRPAIRTTSLGSGRTMAIRNEYAKIRTGAIGPVAVSTAFSIPPDWMSGPTAPARIENGTGEKGVTADFVGVDDLSVVFADSIEVGHELAAHFAGNVGHTHHTEFAASSVRDPPSSVPKRSENLLADRRGHDREFGGHDAIVALGKRIGEPCGVFVRDRRRLAVARGPEFVHRRGGARNARTASRSREAGLGRRFQIRAI